MTQDLYIIKLPNGKYYQPLHPDLIVKHVENAARLNYPTALRKSGLLIASTIVKPKKMSVDTYWNKVYNQREVISIDKRMEDKSSGKSVSGDVPAVTLRALGEFGERTPEFLRATLPILNERLGFVPIYYAIFVVNEKVGVQMWGEERTLISPLVDSGEDPNVSVNESTAEGSAEYFGFPSVTMMNKAIDRVVVEAIEKVNVSCSQTNNAGNN